MQMYGHFESFPLYCMVWVWEYNDHFFLRETPPAFGAYNDGFAALFCVGGTIIANSVGGGCILVVKWKISSPKVSGT